MDTKDSILEIMFQISMNLFEMLEIPLEYKESLGASIKFRRELSKESDRGCALLAAAHMDSLLEQLLKKVLVGNKKHFESLFSFNGPLGTLSGKVSMCYSLGLISFDAMSDIHIIRRIRNEFGHSPFIISFEDPKISKQCNLLKYSVLDKSKPARSKFLNTVSGIAGIIDFEILEKEKFKEAIGIDLQKRKENFDYHMNTIKNTAEKYIKDRNKID